MVTNLFEDVDVEIEDTEPLPLQEAIEHRTRQVKNLRHRRKQWFMTITLLPFAFTYFVNPYGWIGYVVLFNGFICHASSALELRWAYAVSILDICCNFLLCIYVNALTIWQPGTAVLTLASFVACGANWYFRSCNSALVHVVFVQWALCFLLYVFESKSRHPERIDQNPS